MIASLGMYDRAETAGANDRLWALIRDALRCAGEAAPEALTRGDAAYWPAWQSPDLVFSQTCGFPYRARLHDHVTLIGAPYYGIAGCPAGHYVSVYVVRRDDPRALADFDGAGLAYNDALSQSGWAAPQNHASALGLHFAAGLETGGHRASALAVAEGRAEFAAIDALTWDFLTAFEPWTAGLRVLGQTAPATPALPYITAKGRDADLYFRATEAAIAALTAADRDLLRIRGLVRLPPAAYLCVPIPPPPAQIAHIK